jgi:predicted ATP-grasp superfamily ATP-dependent carboligase
MSWFARYRARMSRGLETVRQPDVQRRLADTPPVVVAPVSTGIGLGILRDLGRLGIPLIALDSEPAAIGLASRYAVPCLCHDPRYDEEAFVEDLERLGAALPQRAVVFPAYDDNVWTLSRHAERLERYYHVPLARWDVMQRLADKELQMKAAWTAGVDTPKTYFVHGPEDLEAAADIVPFPALFKPLRHQEMRRRFGVKVVAMATAADLAAGYEKARQCGSLMLQEIVPGDDREFYTFGAYQDASSRALGAFVSRKVRQHPRNFGESRIAESCWVEDVADDALRLLHELSFHGVSGTEFKRDPRDGRLKLMEVNARHWLHHSLSRAAGVNLSLIAYCDALGRPIEGGRQIDGVRWLDSPREARDSLLELARRELNVETFVSGLRSVRVDAVFAFDDPAPALRELVSATVTQVERDLAKLSPGSR